MTQDLAGAGERGEAMWRTLVGELSRLLYPHQKRGGAEESEGACLPTPVAKCQNATPGVWGA